MIFAIGIFVLSLLTILGLSPIEHPKEYQQFMDRVRYALLSPEEKFLRKLEQ